MKFTINRARFLKVLNIVNIAVVAKSPTPAYLNFKIEVLSDRVLVTGSNGELTITSYCPFEEGGKTIVTNYEEGATLISAKFLIDIVRSIDSESVTIEVIDNVIARVSNNKYQSKLNSMPADEYPDLDLQKKGETVVFLANDFKKIISQTAFAASTREVRPILTAINCKSVGSNVEFLATDNYRLSKKVYEMDDEYHFVANIPVKTLNEVSKLIEDGEIELNISNNKVVFTYKETTIYSRLVAGDFPNTTKMIPVNFPYVLQVNADAFISAMQRVSLLAVERENIVKLSVSSEECVISSKSEQIGSADENIEEYRYTGGLFEISFNVNYVIDAIKACQSEDVVLSFVGEVAAFKITSPTDDSIMQIVTPVRSFY